MKKSSLFVAFLCLVLCLVRQAGHNQEVMFIESKEATYEAHQIILTEEVKITHPLGKLSAEKIVMTAPESEKKGPLGVVDLYRAVNFQFQSGANLSCTRATLNYPLLEGTFWTDEKQELVIYKEQENLQLDSSKKALIIKSRRIQVQLQREENLLTCNKIILKQLTAHEAVQVEYQKDFFIIADEAIYEGAKESHLNRLGSTGYIQLKAKPERNCKFCNLQGDLISAPSLEIDLAKQEMTFDKPEGILKIKAQRKEGEKIYFCAQKMIWDRNKDQLKLQKEVVINQQGLGQLKNSQEVLVSYCKIEGKKQLKTIESQGKTQLTYNQDEQSHEITCYGKVLVDQTSLQLILTSPINSAGKVNLEQQICFENSQGELFADKAVISYEKLANELLLKKIKLQGNVRLHNRQTADKGKSAAFAQYALSDQLDYDSTSKTILLTAFKGKRVLFYDKAHDLQISAAALKMTRDPLTAKEIIKGIGDVRFSFVEHEFEHLHQRFFLTNTP